MEKTTIRIAISSSPRVRKRSVTIAMPASRAPVFSVTVMKAPMARTKKNTPAAPARSPTLYGPVAPAAVIT